MESIKSYSEGEVSVWKKYRSILLVGLLLRIIASIFSGGYGMHDDHFLIIEASGSWVEGQDYNKWLPWTIGNEGPQGHSFTYVGLNFILFYILKLVGVVDPKIMMFFVRLVHGLLSMLTIIYGIKITERLSNQKNASIVGWILAALWCMPFLGVHQLFEWTPVPFLMLGSWYVIKNPEKMMNFLIAGLCMGFATSFRYQIGVYAIGIAAVMFFQWKWKPFLMFCAGVLLMFIFTQGFVDFCIWGYPFAEMQGYVKYNMKEGTQYMPNHNYGMYFFVLMGLNFLPLGIYWMIGFFKTNKDSLMFFVACLLFLVFHTLYPNRQERFILSILPMFTLLGVIGFASIIKGGYEGKLWKRSWIIFWMLNIPALAFTTVMYSKKSRVEAMYSVYEKNAGPKNLLMEGSGSGRTSMLPRFYNKDWEGKYINRDNAELSLKVDETIDYDYIFFFDDEKLDERIAAYKTIYPNMELHKKCYPSTLDVMLRKVNPRNANEYIEVWKTNVIQ